MDHYKVVESHEVCLITGTGTRRAVSVGFIPGRQDGQYISVGIVESLARAIGWVSAEAAEGLRDEVAAHAATIGQLEAALVEANAKAEIAEAAVEAGDGLAQFYRASARIEQLRGEGREAVGDARP